MDMSKVWAYQEADLAVDRYETTIKSSANRSKMVKLRNVILDLQGSMKKIENDIQRFHLALDALRKERETLEAAIDDGLALLDEQKVSDLERIRAMQADAANIASQLGALQHDVERVQLEITTYEKNYRDIRTKVLSSKNEFDALKVQYDAELAGSAGQLAELQAKREALAEALDPVFSARYKAIKSIVTPPCATLNGDRCGGCNMSLPSVVIKDVRDAKRIVECDNCSRILFASEG